MPPISETIRLLILDPDPNEAEGLVSVLRNSGRATRAHRITSEEDLIETLSQGTWDLMLLRDSATEPSPDIVLNHINRLDKDIPALLLQDEHNRDRKVEIMGLGAVDALPHDDHEQLGLILKRELRNLQERRRRRLADAHLQESEQRCTLLLESSRDAVAYIKDGMHVYANRAYMELVGEDDLEELICIPVLDILGKDSQKAFRESMKRFAETREDGEHLDAVVRTTDDQSIDVRLEMSPATFEGEPCVQIMARPREDQSDLAAKLRRVSSEDVLTGLYNRQYFMDHLTQTIASVQDNGHNASLAFIALDHFVRTKTQVGIPGADLILADIANILKDEVEDDIIVARLSDDAFALLTQKHTAEELKQIAERVRRKIADHLFEVSGRTVQLTVSIGIAPITDNAPQATDLLGRAHVASNRVRTVKGQEEGNGIWVFTPQLDDKASTRESTDAIQKALNEDRFRLLFQPIVNLRGDGEEHYEAFVRMLDKQGEEVSPYDFLPPTGPASMASRIDRWVVLKTIKRLAAHRGNGRDTRLFLNVTAETLQDPEFAPWIRKVLTAARLPGNALIFQVSEHDATTYLKQIRDFSRSLQKLHCRLSITHFGGAINPFNTLKHLDATYVKLDPSFTEELQKSKEALKEVKEMIQALQQHGKLTIVPKVENAMVLATLWQAGANYIQGYYLQAPEPEMNYDFSDAG